LSLDGGVEGDRVWMTCTCGAVINRDAVRDWSAWRAAVRCWRASWRSASRRGA